MKKQYVAVLDSGIGGLTTLYELVKTLPNENFLYYGDNYNAPYGNRVKGDLISLLKNSLDKVLQFDLKCIVVACNTLSVSALEYVRNYSPIETFGIYPPVEKAIISGEKTLLLATAKTAKNYKSNNLFLSFGLVNLAKDIEDNIFNLERINVQNHLKPLGQINEINTLILGCTHYNFIKNEIINHLKPQLTICGNKYLLKNVENFIKSQKHKEKSSENEILFIGDNADFNKKVYFHYAKNVK
ncbi:MAG: aspartate/glutamate racemase family protein [Clostridia bacterium]|nr:aspartate/glutamate racemase family protein [Clostridia bacterium]